MAHQVDSKIPNPSTSNSNVPTNDDHSLTQAEDADGMQNRKSSKPSPVATDSPMSAPDDSKSLAAREASPGRPQVRTNQSRMSSVSRSRRGSQDKSPSRGSATPTNNTPSIPSAAAVQRALSATRPPTLQPSNSETSVDTLKANASRLEDPPQWPISPRLKSPPPSSRTTPTTVRRSEPGSYQTQPPKLSATSTPDLSRTPVRLTVDGEEVTHSGHRSGRGVSGASTLEPVAEGSQPNTPAPGTESGSYGFKSGIDVAAALQEAGNLQQKKKKTAAREGDSGTESGSGKSRSGKADDKESTKQNLSMTASKSNMMPTKRSFTTLNPSKPSSRTMTVETETVSSIPQVSLGVGAGDRGPSGRMEPSGSVRLKPSNETIRPKKEKKRTARKPTSINAGTVSSKADIFEAKVASAVDEATSSDSDETFVYESNPPDAQSRHVRHHSRTPSTTSMASLAETTSSRYRSGQKEGQHSVAGKRSMKFTNSAYNSNLDGEMSTGSARGVARNGNVTPRHHHIGRYGRGGHASLFDTDSPFTQAARAPSSGQKGSINTSRLSRPSSPRVNGIRNGGTPTRKGEEYGHDYDDEAADDERTPLVGSVRINRARHVRRPNSASIRQMEYLEQRDRSFLSRFGACIIVTLLLLVLLFGASAFVVALTKPLADVSVKHIQNVLASEQEIMLDLDVVAINPNLFAITVSELNVDIFARSGYVRAPVLEKPPSALGPPRKSFIQARRNASRSTHDYGSDGSDGGGVDEGTDPIDEPEADPRTMLLGRIYDFDSPLVFEASPLRRKSSASVGQVRLQKPGNKTEQGGSVRWERVLQHSFELTVRGNIKYQLPLSARVQTAQIQSSVRVGPDEEGGGSEGDQIGGE